MPSRPIYLRLRCPVACVISASVLCVALAAPAQAQGADRSSAGDDTSEDSSEASSSQPVSVESASNERSAGAQDISALEADRAAVRQQVAQAKAARDHQYDKWAMAHLAASAAQERTDKAAMLAVQAQMRVAETEEQVVEYAIDAYMNPPMIESMATLAVSDSEEASWAHSLLSITADEKGAVLDDLADAQRSASLRVERAQRIATEAADAAAQTKTELDALEAELEEQKRLDAQIDSRLDSALAEAAALSEVDQDAADELVAGEQALAEESKSALSEEATPASSSNDDSAQGSSSEPNTPTTSTKPTTTTTTTPRPSTPPPKPPSDVVTWADVTKVGTFWVNRSIASKVQGLLSAASAAGFNLSGGGFRDPAQQIELRQAHCGDTYYDIYEKPASQCTPPTAIPGRSMHERGLALDIKSGGALIRSRSDPAFVWLAANASRFGFYNLPSEPWHWSVNGS